MTVVSNTSPVSNLAAVGRLDLLRAGFGQVLVPSAVAEELAAPGSPLAASSPLPPWLMVTPVADTALLAALAQSLDRGEAEAIALGVERGAGLLVLDERRARQIARAMGLEVIGVLGVLLHAKRAGLIDAVGPVLDDLIARAGFWVGTELRARVLLEAGE